MYTHINNLGFLFNWLIFLELLQVKPVPKGKLLETVVAELLQAGCPSCHPTNSIKALKEENTLISLKYFNVSAIALEHPSVL